MRLHHVNPLLSKHRLEGLTDGVFAIVMTLLVLELKVPDLPKPVDQAEILHKLGEIGPVFFSFVITFVLAGVFWYFHNLAFHYIQKTNRAICWANIGVLVFVALLPFSTALLGRYLRLPVALLFYFVNQFGIAIMMLILWWSARRQALVTPDANPRDLTLIFNQMKAIPVACAVAIVVTLVQPTAALMSFTLTMVLIRAYQRRIERRTA
jgi:uncharacterized membrane protein